MHSCEFNYKVYEYCASCDFKSSKYAKVKDLGLNNMDYQNIILFSMDFISSKMDIKTS